MSYQNPRVEIGPAFNVFGEGTFRFVYYETFDWADAASSMEKLTNEGWMQIDLDEAARVCGVRSEERKSNKR